MQIYLTIIDSVASERWIRLAFTPDRSTNPFSKFLRSIQEGELPLSAIVITYVENLFLSYHIKSRINEIGSYLQFEELRRGLSSLPDKAAIVEIKSIQKNLSKLENMLSSGVRLKILLIISPIIPVVTWALDFFSIKVNLSSLGSLHLAGIASQRPVLIILGFGTLVYVLAIVSSSFIAKRQIMMEKSVYQLERELFAAMNRRRPHELPLDVIGWTLLVVLYGIFYGEVFQRNLPFRSLGKATLILVVAFLVIYVCAFLFALVQRLKRQQW